jgi:hypothetical protein
MGIAKGTEGIKSGAGEYKEEIRRNGRRMA